MGLLRGNSGARTVGWRVILLLMVRVISLLSVALGQNPIAFSYFDKPNHWQGTDNPADTSELNGENITCTLQSQSNGTNLTRMCLYKNPVKLQTEPCPCLTASFGTMFRVLPDILFSAPGSPEAHLIMAFIIANKSSTQAEGGHNFGVTIHFTPDLPGQSLFRAHVGVDFISLRPVETLLIDWELTVWIQYDATNKSLDVYAGQFELKPPSPIISTGIDLSQTLSGPMFVGFHGSISNMSLDMSSDYFTSHHSQIVGWTFNSNGPAPDIPRNSDGTIRMKRQVLPVDKFLGMIPAGIICIICLYIIQKLYRRNARLTAHVARIHDIDPSMLDQGPTTFTYKELTTATNAFSSSQLLGSGGFGSVYFGKLLLKRGAEPIQIAVKRISATSDQGASEFLAEVKIIGQVQHRNLVRLLGWCHERGELLLVYDYMPNGSVDHHLYQSTPGEKQTVLTWSRRLKIVSGVATALVFLHDEWHQRVIHRDLKSSNIMLDFDFNARLGDFGLARTSEHDKELLCTAVAGTRGYLAPELPVTFQPTEKTDVYRFGAVVLELATGKKPMLSREDKKSLKEMFLVDWVWSLYRDDALLDAADRSLHNAYDPREMIMFMKIGLLCCHPNPDERPTMRDVINIWKGLSPFPPVPRSRPVPVFPSHSQGDDTTVLFTSSSKDWADQSRSSGTSALDRDGQTALTITSQHDADSPPLDDIEGGEGGSAHNTLRYRPRTTNSLPF